LLDRIHLHNAGFNYKQSDLRVSPYDYFIAFTLSLEKIDNIGAGL